MENIPDEVESAGLVRLDELLRRIEPLRERIVALHAEPGSRTAEDDLATPYDPLSYQVHHLASAALDQLETLHDVVVRAEAFRMLGNYSLIRAAIEAAGLGIWLLTPGRKDARIMRSLKLVLDQATKTVDLAAKLGHDRTAWLARVEARLLELQHSRKALRQRTMKTKPIIPTMTEVLLEVGQLVRGKDMLPPVAAWSACASMTHGNRLAQMIVLERRKIGELPTGGNAYMVTSSYAATARLLETAIAMLTFLVTLAEQHNLAK
ncbi:hypothetical protein [Agrococcus sp. ProA11]|uniref:hypothetical protein n=1 Tax=Agrococcus chionoecetis TaxID=3153752 RepID=UPI00326131DB